SGFYHHRSTKSSLLQGPRRAQPQIINVPRLVALIAGANFFPEYLGQRQARKLDGRERQQLKITLRALRSALWRQRGRFAPADLQLDFNFTRGVPFMRVCRIDAP